MDFDYLPLIQRAPPITLIGVIGDEGKTTTAHITYEFLKSAYPEPTLEDDKIIFTQAPSVFWVNTQTDPEAFLKKIKREDIVIVELDEPTMKKYDEAGINLQIIVCTSILPVTHHKEIAHAHDMAISCKRQTSNNYLVIGEDTYEHVKKNTPFSIKSKLVFKQAEDVPRAWSIPFKGYHNKENVALALGVADIFKVPEEGLQRILETLKVLPGRLQSLGKVKGIEVYNDASARTPGATLAALRTLSRNKNVTLIIGGQDNGFNVRFLLPHLKEYCSGIVLLAGTGTLSVHKNVLGINSLAHEHAQNLEEAFEKGLDMTRSGDILLFSPAFGCVSENSRSQAFIDLVEKKTRT
jgi:UDP-N-acetylmuramoylalanine-D-glutamate ligase